MCRHDTLPAMPAPHGTTAISFRAMQLQDLPLIHAWRLQPHLQPWWFDPGTLAAFTARYAPRIEPGSDVHGYIACRGAEAIGFMQCYLGSEPGERGIDQFLAHAHQLGQGLGTAMVRAFVESLFDEPTVTRVVTDPAPLNQRAIRCYRRVGFVDQGEVQTPDGPALLMACTRTSLMAAAAAMT